MKKMMVSCVVCSPSKGVEMERAIMYEPVDIVVDIIGSDENVNKAMKVFEDLLQETKDFDPDDDGRYDFDW